MVQQLDYDFSKAEKDTAHRVLIFCNITTL